MTQGSPRAIALAGAGVVAVSYGLARYGYGLFVPEFRRELGIGAAQVGLISSGSYAAFALALASCTALVERHGPRRVILLAAVSAAVGTALVAVAQSAAMLAVGVAVAGASVGWCWTPFTGMTETHVTASQRPHVQAVVATGTSLGLLLAAPLAVLASDSWRAVWTAFAVVAAAVALLNWRALPDDPPAARAAQRPRERPAAGPFALLALYAFVYGLPGAVFFTFAVDLAQRSGHAAGTSAMLWAVVGLAGLAAAGTGAVLVRIGLRATVVAILAGLAASLAVIGLAPGDLPILVAATAVHGAFYMAGSAAMTVWAARLLPGRATFVHTSANAVNAVASIIGPVLAGALAADLGLGGTFVLAAVLPAGLALALVTAPPLPRLMARTA